MSATPATFIGLGRLIDLVVRLPDGARVRVTPERESWLAWQPDARDLVVLHPRGDLTGSVSAQAKRRHRLFHGSDPAALRSMEQPHPVRPVQTLGLVESVTYVAESIRSPSKGRHFWQHHFGDRGERGHGAMKADEPAGYCERHLPRLDVDAAGHLFIVRRVGNHYHVGEWIVG